LGGGGEVVLNDTTVERHGGGASTCVVWSGGVRLRRSRPSDLPGQRGRRVLMSERVRRVLRGVLCGEPQYQRLVIAQASAQVSAQLGDPRDPAGVGRAARLWSGGRLSVPPSFLHIEYFSNSLLFAFLSCSLFAIAMLSFVSCLLPVRPLFFFRLFSSRKDQAAWGWQASAWRTLGFNTALRPSTTRAGGCRPSGRGRGLYGPCACTIQLPAGLFRGSRPRPADQNTRRSPGSAPQGGVGGCGLVGWACRGRRQQNDPHAEGEYIGFSSIGSARFPNCSH